MRTLWSLAFKVAPLTEAVDLLSSPAPVLERLVSTPGDALSPSSRFRLFDEEIEIGECEREDGMALLSPFACDAGTAMAGEAIVLFANVMF